jgi:hypothetical protein
MGRRARPIYFCKRSIESVGENVPPSRIGEGVWIYEATLPRFDRGSNQGIFRVFWERRSSNLDQKWEY